MGKGRKSKDSKPAASACPLNRLGDPDVVQLVDTLNISKRHAKWLVTGANNSPCVRNVQDLGSYEVGPMSTQ